MLRLPAVCCWRHPGAGRGSGASFCGALSCAHAPDGRVTVRGAVMGTVFTVRAYPGSGMDAEDAERICGEALACAFHWEKVMSAMDAESGLARLSCGIRISVRFSGIGKGASSVPELCPATNGAFDLTLGPAFACGKRAAALAFSRPMRSGNARSGHADGKSCPSVREWRSRRFLE